jgi:hypothetical protein
MLLPFISAGQIPEGHFLDADDSEEKGYKIKPFIQKDKGIYHYNVLSELPFETNCDGYDSREGELSCPEMTLGILVGQQIKQSTDYQGVAYIYFTVTEQADIDDIKIKPYPPSDEIDRLLTEAVNRVSVKPAKYNRKTVRSRLWTKIDFKKRN